MSIYICPGIAWAVDVGNLGLFCSRSDFPIQLRAANHDDSLGQSPVRWVGRVAMLQMCHF